MPRWDLNKYTHTRSELDLEEMTIEGYLKLPRASERKTQHQMQFSVIIRTLLLKSGGGGLTPLPGDAVCVFLSPHQQDWFNLRESRKTKSFHKNESMIILLMKSKKETDRF